MAEPSRATLTSRAGKYLTFILGKETYGLEIQKVEEIVGMASTTRVPGTAEFLRGVINLRGRIVPVVDLRIKLGLETVPDTRKTCIIVVRVPLGARQVTLGLIVDEVFEVLAIGQDRIEPAPSFGSIVSTDTLLGIGKVGENVVLLLDVDKALSESEVGLVGEARRDIPQTAKDSTCSRG